MKNKRVIWLIAVLAALTAVLALIHLTTRTPEKEGYILVNGESVAISDIQMAQVSGEVVNGKGEKKQIDAQGVSLYDVCGEFAEATITASDEYSATVYGGEDAYLILSDGGSLRLIVFGDENAKRDLKNVSRIEYR